MRVSGPAIARSRTRAGDDGFTLVELLVATVILGVIIAAIGGVVVAYIRNTDATSDRLALSHDAQISAAYFAADVASLGVRDYADASGNAPLVAGIDLDAGFDARGRICGTAATPTALVRFLSDDWSTATTPPTVGTDVVAYYLRPAGDVAELHRLACVAGSATPVADVVVAHNVDPATPVRLACDGGAPDSCDPAVVPHTVTLTFSVVRPGADPYPISLTGQRRQS